MKVSIYFFTGTGNSLKIAKDLAEKLDDSELLPIAKLWQMENLSSTSEKVGFIFPLYYFGLPKIVYEFIDSLDLSKSNYIFTVITTAGDIDELPFQQLNKILLAKGKQLNAGFYITMPSNYIILKGYGPPSEKRKKEYFEKASKEVESISEIINNKKENLNQDIFEIDVSRSERLNNTFREEVHESDNSFYVDENCTSCGICEDVCPVNNIILVEGTPKWQHMCQQCLACINFCPEESIQYGSQTIKTERYTHPEITVQDITNQKK